MLIHRYNGRKSSLSIIPRSGLSASLRNLSYHNVKRETLKPITSYESSTGVSNDQYEPIDELNTEQTLTSKPIIHHLHHIDVVFPVYPHINIEQIPEQQDLLKKKISSCEIMCDFTDPEADIKAKQQKASALQELSALFESKECYSMFTEDVWQALYRMICRNLFRDITDIKDIYMVGEEEPIVSEIAWPHLSIVYTIVMSLLRNDPQCPLFSDSFLRQLVILCRSSDLKERDSLRQLFLLFVQLNPAREHVLWKQMCFVLIGYSEGVYPPFVADPILRFLNERYSFFKKASPLSNKMFHHAILPLMQTQHPGTVFRLITPIISHVLKTDSRRSPTVLFDAIQKFPWSYPSRQQYYLRLLIAICQTVTPEDFPSIMVPFFALITKCTLSSYSKIVEVALGVWNNVQIIPNIVDNSKDIFQLVIPAIARIHREHWNAQIKSSAFNALRSLRDIDPFVYDECLITVKRAQSTLNTSSAKFDSKSKSWGSIARTAYVNAGSIDLAKTLAIIQRSFPSNGPIPFTKDTKAFKSSYVSAPQIIAPAQCRRSLTVR